MSHVSVHFVLVHDHHETDGVDHTEYRWNYEIDVAIVLDNVDHSYIETLLHGDGMPFN